MIYIIEGPDGSGKSTLVDKLKAVHNDAVVMHFGAPETADEADKYWQVYLRALQHNADKTIIFDRSWYSDMVYGPIMRGRLELQEPCKDALEMAVKALGGGIVIYCTGKQSTMWSRCQKRGENYIKDVEQHKAICQRYDLVMHGIKLLPVVRYDTTARW